MITKRILELLKFREFISVATCDLAGRPNAAPKFLLKALDGHIFLIDYIIGRTHQNIKINPRVSLSFVDTDSLIGYQINGSAELIESGHEYEKLIHELSAREIDLSIKRVIEGVNKGKVHGGFEVGLTDKFVVIKIKIEEGVELSPRGTLKREKT